MVVGIALMCTGTMALGAGRPGRRLGGAKWALVFVFVFAALAIYEFVLFAIDGWSGHPLTSPLRWAHAVTGALLWPPVAAILGAGSRGRA